MFFIIMTPLRKLSFGKIPCVLLIVGKRFNCLLSKTGFATFYKENGRTEICYKILTSMKKCRALHYIEGVTHILLTP